MADSTAAASSSKRSSRASSRGREARRGGERGDQGRDATRNPPNGETEGGQERLSRAVLRTRGGPDRHSGSARGPPEKAHITLHGNAGRTFTHTPRIHRSCG